MREHRLPSGSEEGGEPVSARRTTRIWSSALLLAALVTAVVFGVVFVGGPRAGEAPVEARDLAIAGDAAATRITLSLSREAPTRVFTLADPPRLVIDLPTDRLAFGAAAERRDVGLVAGLHRTTTVGERARLVFDLAASARVASADLGHGRDARLTVDLEPSARAAMRTARPIALGGADPVGETTGAIAPKPTQTNAAAAAPAVGDRRPVIVVDPGHGGVDVGTRSPATGLPEKTVVLQMADVLIGELEKTGRYEVRSTRTSDVFVPLSQRVAIARTAKADLFVSIHADAEYDHSVRGATIYTVSEKASDARAAALAAKENAADAVAGHVSPDERDEVGDILADLTLRETRRFSLLAARDILDEYRRHGGRLVKGEAHRQAGLKVLRAHDVPSVLVEIGFLSNKEDEALMTSPAWREATAKSLVRAIDRFFAGRGVPGAARAADENRTGASTPAAASP